jgi:hypothetical protein
MIYQASCHPLGAEPWDSDEMETLHGQVGDATIFRIAELDATPALQGLIPQFDLAKVSRAGWLTRFLPFPACQFLRFSAAGLRGRIGRPGGR